MNAEHLLDAMGRLDDSLIREAEEYRRAGQRAGRWIGWAASFAVVLVLGYTLTHIGMGGGNSAAPSGGGAASKPAASVPPAGETMPNGGLESGGGAEDAADCSAGPDSSWNGGQGTAAPESPEPGDVPEEQTPAIMVDGVLYRSTGRTVPGEVDESAARQVTSYSGGLPGMDGQTNFSPDLSARYAMTGLGLVVLVDNEWVLFEPVGSGAP